MCKCHADSDPSRCCHPNQKPEPDEVEPTRFRRIAVCPDCDMRWLGPWEAVEKVFKRRKSPKR